MKLNKPAVASGGFTDSWRPDESGTFKVRVFPFLHEGENQLATHIRLHFQGGNGAPVACMGKGCPMCAEAISTKNKRLGATNKYPMLVVVEGGEGVIQRYDAASSVYSAISGILDDDDSPPEDVLGNEGVDFIIKYKKGAKNPSEVYTVSLRRKGSEVLEIETDSLPDLIEECAKDNANPVSDADDDSSDDGATVVFKDSRGKKHTGIYNGKKQGDKFIIEVDGHIRKVQADRIISGIDVDDPNDDGDTKFEVGMEVMCDDPDEGSIVVEIKEIDGEDFTVGNDDFDDWVVASDVLSFMEGGATTKEEEPEDEEPEDEAPESVLTVGDNITVNDPDEGEVEVVVVSIDEDEETMMVENDDYDPWELPVSAVV